jgi:hypothetical protein
VVGRPELSRARSPRSLNDHFDHESGQFQLDPIGVRVVMAELLYPHHAWEDDSGGLVTDLCSPYPTACRSDAKELPGVDGQQQGLTGSRRMEKSANAGPKSLGHSNRGEPCLRSRNLGMSLLLFGSWIGWSISTHKRLGSS